MRLARTTLASATAAVLLVLTGLLPQRKETAE